MFGRCSLKRRHGKRRHGYQNVCHCACSSLAMNLSQLILLAATMLVHQSALMSTRHCVFVHVLRDHEQAQLYGCRPGCFICAHGLWSRKSQPLDIISPRLQKEAPYKGLGKAYESNLFSAVGASYRCFQNKRLQDTDMCAQHTNGLLSVPKQVNSLAGTPGLAKGGRRSCA